MIKKKTKRTLNICGVIALGSDVRKVLVPAPLLVLDSIAWAHTMLNDAITLAATARSDRSTENEAEYRGHAHSMKMYIELLPSDLSEFPALEYRAKYRPLIVSQLTLRDYFRSIENTFQEASDTTAVQFIVDTDATATQPQLMGTEHISNALNHASDIRTSKVGHGFIVARVIEMKPPWQKWR